MKTKNSIQLWLIVSIISLLSGCTKYADYTYKVISLSTHHADNSGASPIDANSNLILSKAYAIRLEYTLQVYGSTEGTDTHESKYKNGNKVTSFNITSPTDFDSTHVANVSLNDYFLYGNGLGGTSIQNRIEKEQLPYLNSGSNPTSAWLSNNYIILMKPPSVTGSRVFVIKLEFADNTSIADTTSTVYLY